MKNFKNEIIEQINCITPDQTAIEFQNKNFDRSFLLMAIKGFRYRLLIFDETSDMTQIAELLYSVRGNKIYISSFEVNENYQQNGLGRMLFEIAMTHGDILGATRIYGDADPINNIKGVSDNENATFEDEQQAIFTIYQKLGCTINPETHGFF